MGRTAHATDMDKASFPALDRGKDETLDKWCSAIGLKKGCTPSIALTVTSWKSDYEDSISEIIL